MTERNKYVVYMYLNPAEHRFGHFSPKFSTNSSGNNSQIFDSLINSKNPIQLNFSVNID
jgi:hypothetical protein